MSYSLRNGRPHSDVLTARQGECGSSIGGKNERSRDRCRAIRRWRFAGDGAKRSTDGQLPACGRRRCGQSRNESSNARTAGTWRHSGRAYTIGCPGSVKNPHRASHDHAPQEDVYVGKEPQRLKAEYHQVATSGPGLAAPDFVRGSFLNSNAELKTLGAH